jgi:hypothetical protein
MSDADSQDQAEALDPDVLADYDDAAYDDPERAFPPDRARCARDYGTTAAEERVDEPLEERVRREERDPLDAIADPQPEDLSEIEAEELFGSDEVIDVGDIDVDEELDRERPVGRLRGPGSDDDGEDLEDDEAEAVAWRADDDDGDLSAEEEAVHLTEDPPYGEPGDGYVDTDDR